MSKGISSPPFVHDNEVLASFPLWWRIELHFPPLVALLNAADLILKDWWGALYLYGVLYFFRTVWDWKYRRCAPPCCPVCSGPIKQLYCVIFHVLSWTLVGWKVKVTFWRFPIVSGFAFSSSEDGVPNLTPLRIAHAFPSFLIWSNKIRKAFTQASFWVSKGSILSFWDIFGCYSGVSSVVLSEWVLQSYRKAPFCVTMVRVLGTVLSDGFCSEVKSEASLQFQVGLGVQLKTEVWIWPVP